MEDFFRLWERALDQISMFKGADEITKMRSYRRLIRRAEPDGREIRLLEATAWRILHYVDRTRARLADEFGIEIESELTSELESPKDSEHDSPADS